MLLAVIFGIGLMGLSLGVGHYDYKALPVTHAEDGRKITENNWVVFLLMELADTGDDLPGKHVHIKTIQKILKKSPDLHKLKNRFLCFFRYSFPGVVRLTKPSFYTNLKQLPVAGDIIYLHHFSLF